MEKVAKVEKVEQKKQSLREKLLKKKWTPQEDDFLIQLYNKGLAYNKITQRLREQYPDRTHSCVTNHIFALQQQGKIEPRVGAKKPAGPVGPLSSVKRWSDQETQMLIDLWNKGATVPEIMTRFPGRTRYSIAMHIDVLQKEGRVKPRWRAGKGKRPPAPTSKPEVPQESPKSPSGGPADVALPKINTTVTIQLNVNCNDRNSVQNFLEIVEKIGAFRQKETSP